VRIVAGKFRGKKLVESDHLKSLRPTTDKNRETLFNILTSAKFIKEIGFKIDGAEILDVCCGSGAVAFEAISRGAKSAFLIDNSQAHFELAKKNSQLLKVENEVKFLCADVKKLPQNQVFFNIVFIDPPYAEDYHAIIKELLEKNWIEKNSLVVVEFETGNAPEFAFENLRLLEIRKSGLTSFAFLI